MDPQGDAPKERELVRQPATMEAKQPVVVKAAGVSRRPLVAARAAKAAKEGKAARGGGEKTPNLHA